MEQKQISFVPFSILLLGQAGLQLKETLLLLSQFQIFKTTAHFLPCLLKLAASCLVLVICWLDADHSHMR